jgi:hypothetical protein
VTLATGTETLNGFVGGVQAGDVLDHDGQADDRRPFGISEQQKMSHPHSDKHDGPEQSELNRDCKDLVMGMGCDLRRNSGRALRTQYCSSGYVGPLSADEGFDT